MFSGLNIKVCSTATYTEKNFTVELLGLILPYSGLFLKQKILHKKQNMNFERFKFQTVQVDFK